MVRDGIAVAITQRENADTIVRTGGANSCPVPTGTTAAGNHRSHCTISPAT